MRITPFRHPPSPFDAGRDAYLALDELFDPVAGMTPTLTLTDPGVTTTVMSAVERTAILCDLVMGAADTGVIFEAGGSGFGIAIYAFNGEIYARFGKGAEVTDGDCIYLQAPFPSGPSRRIRIVASASKTTGAGMMFFDGKAVSTGSAQSIQSLCGADPGGIARVYGVVAANEGGFGSASPDFSGTINKVVIFNNQQTEGV